MPLPKIIFAGAGEFGVPTLERLVARGFPIARVYTQPDKPAGRGHTLTPTPVGKFALEQKLDLVRTVDLNSENLPSADLLLIIAFGQKLSQELVSKPTFGAINLHASRLPKFRGAAPINWAVIEGEEITGNSIIRIADRMDAGNVLGMSEIEIGELETAGEIHDRLARDGAELVERVINELSNGRAVEVEQDHGRATRAKKLSRELAVIDWTRPAKSIANQIRGMFPWPGIRVKLIESSGNVLDRFTLIRARCVGTTRHESPGFIDGFGRITSGEGEVEIVELQPEGKRPMSLEAYRNGKPWPVGARLESVT
ncbi:MAG TPA: methionyl-tRNA formyltransferase [Tepidisphaeraceae bacterium]|nr:methionyl-tRNA formyltransferase [Tepidisphaeraceae bacterium]